MRILIAENDLQQVDRLNQLLTGAQYEITCVSNGDELLLEALRRPCDLVLLDLMQSGQDGLTTIRELRRCQVQTPVMVLTARNTVADKVMGLDAGADDYMTKPFASDELLARIRALLRRSGIASPETLEFGDLYFRPENVSIVCDEHEVRLNYKESEIFKLFLASSQRIISKDELIRRIWGRSSNTSDNNVEAYISFLRKKLHQIGSRVQIIAIKKQGYKLEYTADA